MRIDKAPSCVYSNSEKICAIFAKKAPVFFHWDGQRREIKRQADRSGGRLTNWCLVILYALRFYCRGAIHGSRDAVRFRRNAHVNGAFHRREP